MMMKKFRMFLDFENEEQWINDMNSQGWQLKKFSLGVFTFEKGEPGEYVYRNEFLSPLMSRSEQKEYFEFLNDTGIEVVHVASNSAYFRKKKTSGQFEIFTDNASKISYLNRMLKFVILLIIPSFLWSISYFFNMKDSGLFDFFSILMIIVSLTGLLSTALLLKQRKKLKKELQLFEQ